MRNLWVRLNHLSKASIRSVVIEMEPEDLLTFVMSGPEVGVFDMRCEAWTSKTAVPEGDAYANVDRKGLTMPDGKCSHVVAVKDYCKIVFLIQYGDMVYFNTYAVRCDEVSRLLDQMIRFDKVIVAAHQAAY